MSSSDSETANLSRNQRRAIAALLTNKTVEDAAREAGVSERTIYRWLESSDFRLALAQAESNAIYDAVRVMVSDMRKNLEVMRQIRDNRKESAAVRLRAAKTLDASLLRWRELRDVETRLSELERMVYGEQNISEG